jgi:uncharacterized RDD family membrane protein YckC
MAAKKIKKQKKAEKKKDVTKAGFSLRAAAFIVDIFLFALLWGIVTSYVGINSRTNNDPFYIFLLVSALVVGVFQTTPGKRFFNLKITTGDSQRISMLRAVVREGLGKFVSSLVFGLGYLWMIPDRQNQTLHDKLTRTYVVVAAPVGKLRIIIAYLLVVAVLFVLISSLVIVYLVRRTI